MCGSMTETTTMACLILTGEKRLLWENACSDITTTFLFFLLGMAIFNRFSESSCGIFFGYSSSTVLYIVSCFFEFESHRLPSFIVSGSDFNFAIGDCRSFCARTSSLRGSDTHHFTHVIGHMFDMCFYGLVRLSFNTINNNTVWVCTHFRIANGISVNIGFVRSLWTWNNNRTGFCCHACVCRAVEVHG